ncbi:acetylxylan esterase [candidate division KSB1 bacterium]|nr:acetylxylan esterase [candidate division KSB1 bacterium]
MLVHAFSLCLFTFILLSCAIVTAQPQGFIYDEADVPDYTLPDPLISPKGKRIQKPQTWIKQQRSYILDLFREHVYGKTPSTLPRVEYELLEKGKNALNGSARRKQIAIRFSKDNHHLTALLLIYLPKRQAGPHPVFVGLNFYGNQSIHPDSAIRISDSWVRNNPDYGITDNRATPSSRGVRQSRWPVEEIINRGYALATMYYGDIDPDYDDGFQNGIHPLYHSWQQNQPDSSTWGSVSAWAWGLSRIMDYLITDSDIDSGRVAVMGHSRLGKTALWAGARDERFALVISNNSGCGGAALSRRHFGETVKRINNHFPHWFCDRFNRYNDNEESLPVDQHMLIALIAPRPVYIASAKEDLWADPRGKFLAALHADPVYKLLGTNGLATDNMPPLKQPIMSTIGYHIRPGKHDVTKYDWNRFMDFADMHLNPNPSEKKSNDKI